MSEDWLSARKTIGDREAYLGFTAIIWIGILTGFVPETLEEGFNYPLIVHLHALTFGGWLALLTVQCLLIRSNRRDLHRKLGIAGAILAPVMLVIGTMTAFTMDRIHFAESGRIPTFLSIQIGDLIAFAVLIPAGLWLRNQPQLHKSMMMLATITLSVAGFARGAGRLLSELVLPGPLQFYEHIYGGTDLVMLAFGCYLYFSRRKLSPHFLAGCGLIVALHAGAVFLYFWPAWKDISRAIVGV